MRPVADSNVYPSLGIGAELGAGIRPALTHIYDPAVGDPDSGIAPGTAFEDIPADWLCPVCGVGKEDFSPAE